jgi:hypothetical protein
MQIFNTPPQLRFWAFELMNIAFAGVLTFIDLPIQRKKANLMRDWLLFIWSIASLGKEVRSA